MIVAHLDLDAFFAAVEELEEPSLRRVPLIVGGDPHGRGVVATCNYVARSFGIHSAMSAAEALRRCPHAVFVRPRHSLYRDYSREVWSRVREIVPSVEQAGIDEGYLDLGEVAPAFDDARALAEAVRAVVRARTRLSCSLGVATSKVVAKVASDRRKPGGLTVVRPGREAAFLAPFPIRILPGVGPRAEERLIGLGIETIGDIAAIADDDLQLVLRGKVGRELRDRARGIDPRPLELSTERISISQEETFARDISDPELLHDELRRMSVQARGAPAGPGPGGAHRHDQGSLPRLRDPDEVDVTAGRDRRRSTDRRACLLAARPCAARPAGPPAPRRGGPLRARRARATFVAGARLNCHRRDATSSPSPPVQCRYRRLL